MKVYETDHIDDTVTRILREKGVGILLTDTIYGIVGRLDSDVITRINRIKNRPDGKSYIVLCIEEQLSEFKIKPTILETALRAWQQADQPTSIVVQVTSTYARNDSTMAIRIPQSETLRKLLKTTGPLVAPSANPHEFPPAQTINQAKDYFSDAVDFYVDQGESGSRASRLVTIDTKGVQHVLR